jgi:hypothetical protein
MHPTIRASPGIHRRKSVDGDAFEILTLTATT